jgi:ubiquinol-cytochrome c reductase cytochrome c1 subunit
MKKLFLLLALLLPLVSFGAEENVQLDTAPIDTHDIYSLQRGARTFMNYCLSCHSAQAMRYSRLEDLGLTEDEIKKNFLPADKKIGDTMTVAMQPDFAKKVFGAAPPDLGLEARARGADWLYTYLRSFYRDDKRPTGWNNTVFNNVGMPHVLWELQGVQVLKTEQVKGEGGQVKEVSKLELAKPGSMTPAQYNQTVADLVNYLTWMGEPAQNTRHVTGILVLLFLGIAFVVVYLLKREYWKEIH